MTGKWFLIKLKFQQKKTSREGKLSFFSCPLTLILHSLVGRSCEGLMMGLNVGSSESPLHAASHNGIPHI